MFQLAILKANHYVLILFESLSEKNIAKRAPFFFSNDPFMEGKPCFLIFVVCNLGVHTTIISGFLNVVRPLDACT